MRAKLEGTEIRNSILRALPADDFDVLAPHLERILLRPRQTLVEPDCPIRDAYFIESGTACIISRSNQHRLVEIGMIGRTGLVGVPAILGVDRTIFRCFVQLPGEALRISISHLRSAMESHSSLRQVMMNYVQAQMTWQAQIILCNTRHSLRQRVARWLLMVLDCIDGNDVPATHDLLARMLGVRRASISETIHELETCGVLSAGRGQLKVLDRTSLAEAACECYSLLRSEFNRLVPPGEARAGTFAQDKLDAFSEAFRLKKD